MVEQIWGIGDFLVTAAKKKKRAQRNFSICLCAFTATAFFFLLAFTRESVYVYVYVYVQYAEECEKTALKMHLFSVFFFLFKV